MHTKHKKRSKKRYCLAKKRTRKNRGGYFSTQRYVTQQVAVDPRLKEVIGNSPLKNGEEWTIVTKGRGKDIKVGFTSKLDNRWTPTAGAQNDPDTAYIHLENAFVRIGKGIAVSGSSGDSNNLPPATFPPYNEFTLGLRLVGNSGIKIPQFKLNDNSWTPFTPDAKLKDQELYPYLSYGSGDNVQRMIAPYALPTY